MADTATDTTTDDTTTDATATSTDAVATDTTTDLGDAGKKALDAERAARKVSEKAAKDAQKERDDLAARLSEIDEANKSDSEKAIEAARKEADAAARAEVTTAYEQRLLEAEVKAAAAGKITDPEDAIRLLNLGELEKNAEGEVDRKTIEAAIADLVKQKPYLATGAKPGSGSADGGARSSGGVTFAQLKTMTPQQVAALDPALVEAAMAAGR